MSLGVEPDPTGTLSDQVRVRLIAEIERGEFRPGEPMPPDRELSDRFGVSRVTMTRALGDLARLGLIDRARGRRGVVVAPKIRLGFDEPVGLTETLRRQGFSTYARVLSRDRVGVESLPDRRGLRAGRFVRVRRLRYVGQCPAIVATSFLPEALENRIDWDNMAKMSLYTAIEGILERAITRREQTVTSIVASAEIVTLLGVARHTAHYNVRSRSYTDDGTLVEVADSIFNGKIFEYVGCLSRASVDLPATP